MNLNKKKTKTLMLFGQFKKQFLLKDSVTGRTSFLLLYLRPDFLQMTDVSTTLFWRQLGCPEFLNSCYQLSFGGRLYDSPDVLLHLMPHHLQKSNHSKLSLMGSCLQTKPKKR